MILQLALRAGNEKEEGETADTVGCCSLRVEHITLHDKLDISECVVEFDFLGKDSIRYYNKVPVIKKVKEQHLFFIFIGELHFFFKPGLDSVMTCHSVFCYSYIPKLVYFLGMM